MKRPLSFGLLIAILSGCGISAPGAPMTLYTLEANTPASDCMHPTSIKIAEPRVAPGLDRRRIAVVDAPNQLDYYTGVAWPTALPEMLQRFLLDAFNRSGRFTSVNSDLDIAESPWLLLTDIYDFQVVQTETPSFVHIRLNARLVRSDTRAVAASIPFEKRIAVDHAQMPALVAAFNQGMNEATAGIVASITPHLPACR